MTTQHADLDASAHKVVRDERVKERNRLHRLMIRPEVGARRGVGEVGIPGRSGYPREETVATGR